MVHSSSDSGTVRRRKFSILQILLWLGISFLALIVIIGLITQTGMFRSWLRDYVVETANENLAGELFIGELNGNLFTKITLSDIAIVLEDDTVLSIGTIHARYDITAILSSTLQIDSVAVDSVHVLLSQAGDSSWNLQHLMPEDTTMSSELEIVSEPFGYTVNLGDIVLSNVTADIHALNEMIPRRLVDFGLHLSATYETNHQQLQMYALHLATTDPQIRITDVQFGVTADTTSIVLTDMALATVSNRVEASGAFYPQDAARNSAQVVASPILLGEFADFLPEMLSGFKGDITFKASLDDDKLSLLLNAIQFDERLNLTASASPVSSLMDSTSPERPHYESSLDLQGITATNWLHDSQFGFMLNGNVNVDGLGVEPDQAEIQLTGNLSGSRLEEQTIDNLTFGVSLVRGDMICSLLTEGAYGRALAACDIKNILGNPEYAVEVNLERLDLRQLGLIDTLDTDINMQIEIDGEGTSRETAIGKVEMTVSPSRAMWLDIEQGKVLASFSSGGVSIDTLNLVTSITSIAASGTINETEEGTLNYAIRVNDTLELANVLGVEEVRLHGQISGLLSGNMTQQHVEAAFQFDNIIYDDLKLESVQGDVSASLSDSTILAQGKTVITAIESGDVLLDSLSVTGKYTKDSAAIETSVWHALVQSRVKARIMLDSLVRLSLEDIDVSYSDQKWSLDDAPSGITIDTSHYTVSNLHFSSTDDRQQTVHIDGEIDFDRMSELTIRVNNLDLSPLGYLVEQDIEGSLSTEIVLTSPIGQPEVTGQFEITDARVKEYDIYGVAGELSFSEEVADFNLNLKVTPSDSIKIMGAVPVLIDSGLISVPDNRPFSINVLIDNFPLDALEVGNNLVEDADGFLDCNLSISEPINALTINGTLSVRDGRIIAPSYGVEYTDLQAGMSFLPNRIVIDSVTMRRDKGRFQLSGNLDYDSSLIVGKIRSSRFDLMTDKFFVARHRDYEIQLTSDVIIEGTDSTAKYSGSIAVDRSRFYLPALIGDVDEELVDDRALPLLVAATTQAPHDSLQNDSTAKDVSTEDSLMVDLMSRLSGRMNITIPKNTWIKSPELSLELAGDLEIVQEGAEPEIFGDIRVMRGHYDLYGRRFKVQRGQVIFQGGDYLNPVLDIEARYILRTPSKEKKELSLLVTGNAEIPVIMFTLDGAEITEGDAVSYIIFGRSLDQLNQSQQSELSQDSDTEQMAGDVASRMLAGQLAGALGRKLNMDIMEIKADGELENAAVIIGKYLTPDLFMSYQRSFGSSTDDDLEPEIVTLEYQLTKLIYLQLTEGDAEEAGFDVILKFEKD